MPFIPVLLILIVSLFVESKTGDNNFFNALNFINQVRVCAIQSEYQAIMLPELADYAKASSTASLTVNKIIENEFIRFWRKIKKCDYEHDRKRLIALSKGAALAVLKPPTKEESANNIGDLPGVYESSLLGPILKGDLPLVLYKMIVQEEKYVLDSLYVMIDSSKEYAGLEKEMVLSAIQLLDVAALVLEYSWGHVSEEEMSALRSDDRALECIRDWARSASSLKILYLSFLLHARQIIAHFSNDAEEARTVTSLQKELELIIYTEFPFGIMRLVGWEDSGPYPVRCLDNGTILEGFVDEVYLLFVKDGRKDIGKFGNLFFEPFKLYASVEESYGNTYPGGWESLLRELVLDISKEAFVIRDNPMLFTLK